MKKAKKILHENLEESLLANKLKNNILKRRAQRGLLIRKNKQAFFFKGTTIKQQYCRGAAYLHRR